MNYLKIQKDIANMICSIGNRIIQNNMPVIESSIEEKDRKDLCRLLKEYDHILIWYRKSGECYT